MCPITKAKSSIWENESFSVCWDTTPQEQAPPPRAGTPRSRQAPPRVGTPPDQTPPERSMLGDTVNERAVRILLECNLVMDCHSRNCRFYPVNPSWLDNHSREIHSNIFNQETVSVQNLFFERILLSGQTPLE